jgi:DNA-binding LacI/PurR family transcriptional regulator
MSARKLPQHQVLEVAVRAQADPRTVRRVVAGQEVRASVKERIERAIRELGFGAAPPAGEPDRPPEAS